MASSNTAAENAVAKNDSTVPEKKKETSKASASKPKAEEIMTCPQCQQGTMMKGKTAFGCNRFKEGCSFKISFEFGGKKLSDKQIQVLIQKKKTPSFKGFVINSKKVNGHLILNKEGVVEFMEEAVTSNTAVNISVSEGQTCPKCKQGTIIKGKSAFGCNRYKEGCDFRVAF